MLQKEKEVNGLKTKSNEINVMGMPISLEYIFEKLDKSIPIFETNPEALATEYFMKKLGMKFTCLSRNLSKTYVGYLSESKDQAYFA